MIYDFNFKYGEFLVGTDGNNLDINYFRELQENIMKAYEMPANPIRADINSGIFINHMDNYNLLIKRIKNGWSARKAVSAFHTNNIENYTLFTLNYIRLDNMLPMFPTKWQIEAANAYDMFEYVSGLTTRKIGKSAFLSSHSPFTACRNVKQIVILAPTTKQMFVMKDVHRAIKTSEFLMDEWIFPKHLGPRHEGRFTTEEIEFGRNHSTISSTNLNINESGETKRGIKGTDIYLDERQTVPKDIKITVISPALSDEFSPKKMMTFGTPNLKYDPDLAIDFEAEKTNPDYYVINYDWMDGIMQGAISAKRMREVFKTDYKIECPFARKYGVCVPRILDTKNTELIKYYLGEKYPVVEDGYQIRWDKYNSKLVAPGDDNYDNSWKCQQQCMMHSIFAEEYGAKFGQSNNPFFTTEMFEPLFRDYAFEYKAKIGAKYIIAADFGKFVYPTQILVFELVGGYLKLVYWFEVPLMVGTMEKDGSPPNYWPIVKELFRIYDIYNKYNGVQKLYLDVNSNIELAYNIVTGNNNHPGIWKGKIFQNEAAKKRGVYGIMTSTQYNTEMKVHYQKVLIYGRMIFPALEPEFKRKFMWEHLNCKIRNTKNGYLNFEPPRRVGAGIDMLDAASMASLHIDPMGVEETMMDIAVCGIQDNDEPFWLLGGNN